MKLQQMQIYVTEEEKKRIKSAAETEGRSVNNFIKWVLSEYLKASRR